MDHDQKPTSARTFESADANVAFAEALERSRQNRTTLGAPKQPSRKQKLPAHKAPIKAALLGPSGVQTRGEVSIAAKKKKKTTTTLPTKGKPRKTGPSKRPAVADASGFLDRTYNPDHYGIPVGRAEFWDIDDLGKITIPFVGLNSASKPSELLLENWAIEEKRKAEAAQAEAQHEYEKVWSLYMNESAFECSSAPKET